MLPHASIDEISTHIPLRFSTLSTLRLLASTPQFPIPVTINPDQSITYNPTPNGDRIPDFSTVGFNYGNTSLPDTVGQPGTITDPDPASPSRFLRLRVPAP